MVAMKCHAKMIPFYSNGEQIGITWSIPEIWTNCIAQLLSVAAVSEVCLGQRPSCNKSCQISPAHPEVNIRQWRKIRKRTFQLPAPSPSDLLSPSPSSTLTWCMHMHTLCVGCRFSPCCPCCAHSSRWCLALGFTLKCDDSVTTWPQVGGCSGCSGCNIL